MTSPLWTSAFAWWLRLFPPAIATLGLVMAARWWWRAFRAGSAVIAETQHAADRTPWPTPAAYLDPIDGLATSLSCTWCRPRPQGHCTCSGKCGHIRCVAPRELFTAADQEILEGKRLP